jgi:hypothetical protein
VYAFPSGEDVAIRRYVYDAPLRPGFGPLMGIPEEVLWLAAVLHRHIESEEQLQEAQQRLLGQIMPGTDLEELWPRFAGQLVAIYGVAHAEFIESATGSVPPWRGSPARRLLEFCGDREQMFKPNEALRAALARSDIKQPFLLALCEAVTDTDPRKPGLAFNAFRDDPAITHACWEQAEATFLKELARGPALPCRSVITGDGHRVIELRSRRQLP